MINTYKLRELKNTVSLLLYGKGGNSVRYEFKYGNVAVGKYPSITLTNRYQIELLESSELFLSKRVVLESSTRTKEDEEEDERTKKEEKKSEEEKKDNTVATRSDTIDGFVSIKEVTTQDELICYINETYGKEFKTAKNALGYAEKMKLHFPNLNMV